MTPNEQALVELLKAYDSGQINFTNAPKIKAIIDREVSRQVAASIKPAEFHAQQVAQLEGERTWYHQQIQKILADQANKIDTEDLQKRLTRRFDQEHDLQVAMQDRIDQATEHLDHATKNQFWKNLIPQLAGGVVALFFSLMILLLFKALVFDGIWHGLGLSKVASFVLTIAKTHPFGGSVLGLIVLVAIVAVVFFSFAFMVEAVQRLADWDAEKLMFWRKERY